MHKKSSSILIIQIEGTSRSRVLKKEDCPLKESSHNEMHEKLYEEMNENKL